MSLITQCPACSTMFKVVPDQLRISDGWVRCGQCDEVFDANANLHSESVPVPSVPESSPKSVAVTSSAPDWAASLRFPGEEPADAKGNASSGAPDVQMVPDRAMGAPSDAKSADVVSSKGTPTSDGLDNFMAQSPKALAANPHVEQESFAADASEALRESLTESLPRNAQAQMKVAEKEETKQPSFMRKQQGYSVWNKASVRVLMGLLVLLSAGVLTAQVAIHERDRWAAYKPAMTPALEALCNATGCSVSPFRNIDAVVIDSSSFTKVRSDVYRLHVVLKNNGPVPLAPPALELTLTNMQDQSLIRRVLKSTEIGFKSNAIAPGAEFSAILPIAVKAGDAAASVSGYRLLAFYP